jgi:hypothetical protein
MSESARVTSIEALKDFRAALIVFCEEAKESLSAVDMETRRTVDWLAQQLAGWQRALRDRQEEVSKAKAELFRRQLPAISGEKPDCYEQKKALRRAQERLREAEEKIDRCKQWARELPRAVDEYAAPAQQLAQFVEGDPPHAVILIDRILDTLDAYTATPPPVTPLGQDSHPGAAVGQESPPVEPAPNSSPVAGSQK